MKSKWIDKLNAPNGMTFARDDLHAIDVAHTSVGLAFEQARQKTRETAKRCMGPILRATIGAVRRRELLLGTFGSILYVACGSDDEEGATPNPDGGRNGDGGPNGGDGGAPLTPTSPADTSHRVFPQGVASGDPRPDRVVLWTRVEPAEAGKGANDDVDLELVIAKDEALTDIVARTPVKAEAKSDHSVKVVPTALEPGRYYYYRFEVAGSGNTTQVGRTKTAPAADADVAVKFAMAACQDYIGRYWHAWKALLDEKLELDFVLYLGDYIYESVNDERFQSTSGSDRVIKLPDGIDTSPKQDKTRIAASTLADYRTLYKTYRKDPLLREVHRLYPFVVTWDDHEFADDSWQDHSTSFNGKDPVTGGPLAGDEKNTPRRTNANRAFWEHQPIDVVYKSTLFFPADIQIYRQLRYGKHVDLFLTDQRQYRADHLTPEGVGADLSVGKFIDYTIIGTRYFIRKSGFDTKEASAKPTLLGAAQKAWFVDAVKKSTATWKVWGNEVQLYQMVLDLKKLPGVPDEIWPGTGIGPYDAYVNGDQWDGYRSERKEILEAFKQANVSNLLVCTGDIHSFYAAELHTDFDAVKSAPTTKPVGVEYVTAGISSASLRALFEKFIPPESPFRFIIDAWAGAADKVLKDTNSPWLKYADTDAYGFAVMTIDGTKAEAQFIQTTDPRVATSTGVVARQKFVTQVGTNKVTAL